VEKPGNLEKNCPKYGQFMGIAPLAARRFIQSACGKQGSRR